jgi:hypothetical protein
MATSHAQQHCPVAVRRLQTDPGAISFWKSVPSPVFPDFTCGIESESEKSNFHPNKKKMMNNVVIYVQVRKK